MRISHHTKREIAPVKGIRVPAEKPDIQEGPQTGTFKIREQRLHRGFLFGSNPAICGSIYRQQLRAGHTG
jgi:hypothetical protein